VKIAQCVRKCLESDGVYYFEQNLHFGKFNLNDGVGYLGLALAEPVAREIVDSRWWAANRSVGVQGLGFRVQHSRLRSASVRQRSA
jgi:hypothetical protein